GRLIGVAVAFGLAPLSAAAEETVTMAELDRLMEETRVYEYANCNELTVPTVVLFKKVALPDVEPKATDRDLAVEAAMDCHKEWLELVKQLASSRGYVEALRIGLEIQDKMIGQNVEHVRAAPTN
ncbi:hypothetical protein AB4144_07945, partial [Rhizobiaceae sp. 2RAB30]